MARQYTIEELVGGYEVFANSPESFGAEVDVCVLERDEIEDRRDELTPALAERLIEADRRLRCRPMAAFADSPYDPEILRESEGVRPAPERWWWYLDRLAAANAA